MAQLVDHLAGTVVGLLVTYLLGRRVTPFIEGKMPLPPRPTELREEDWRALTARTGHGDTLGLLERFLSYGAFAVSEFAILGGWLAFKLAAKWEVWKNVVQVPSEVEGIAPLVWLQARSAYSSWLLSRFLVGTLANILVGFVGVQVGLLYCRYLKWLC